MYLCNAVNPVERLYGMRKVRPEPNSTWGSICCEGINQEKSFWIIPSMILHWRFNNIPRAQRKLVMCYKFSSFSPKQLNICVPRHTQAYQLVLVNAVNGQEALQMPIVL